MPFVKKSFNVSEEILAFRFVMNMLGLTQSEAQRHIDRGRILIGGESMTDKSAKICGEIEMVYFEPKSRGEMPLFINKDFMVFEKSSGILVHPKTMETPYSMLDEIRHHSGTHANAVHRIDKETSGLLMASRHKIAEKFLKNSFERGVIQKSYLAWVDGRVEKGFEVDLPLRVREDYSADKHKVHVHENGKKSRTTFEPLEYDQGLDTTLLACYPHTGRTHQIRVHLFHVKHPILGDPIYGTSFDMTTKYLEDSISTRDRLEETGATRLLLHAHSLKFHYGSDYCLQSKVDFREVKKLICPKEERRFNFRK